MKLGWKRTIVRAMEIASVCLLAIASASGQVEQKQPMAEEVFKNVQVLKGISVNEFMGTMGFFSASLGLNCVDCHISESSGDWGRYADDTALKRTTRRMILMVNNLNKSEFGGRRAVTCYTCHRYTGHPKGVPSLAEQYGTPPPDDPNEIEILGQAPATPSANQVLDRYLQALGGAQKLASLTSFIAKGTYDGYDSDFEKVPVEIFAKAPNQHTTIVHMRIGDSITTYDGRAGWVASPDKPLPLLTFAGKDLDGLKLEADLSFPAMIQQDLTQWRAGFPKTTIADRDVQVIQGTGTGGSRVKLYFDKESGLLVRTVRYTVTAVGIIPAQTDYSDYRDVAGVKIPFHWTMTWTDGQSTVELSEVRPNASIDSTKFSKPAPAPPPKTAVK